MKKIKVIHIINNLEIGGAEKVLALLLKHLKEYKNLELSVVSLEGHGPLEKDITNLGIKVKNFRYHFLRRYIGRFDPYFRLGLFIYIRRERPSLIHGHLMGGQDIAKMMGALTGTPVVSTAHDTLIIPGFKQKFLDKYLTKEAGVSEGVVEYLEKVCHLPKNKIVLIPDAIEVDDFKDSKKYFNSQKPVFLYIGRLFKTKGIEFAIEGLAKLRGEYSGLRFLIYGKKVFQNDFDKWQQLIKKNNWDFVSFMGPTDDVASALKKGDIFILPSESEGFSMAVLEAAAASKPVIATRAGAIPEMVEEGGSGYFVEYGNAEQIYKTGKNILDNNEVEKFGARSYEIVKDKFSIKKVAKMYYNLYLEVINK